MYDLVCTDCSPSSCGYASPYRYVYQLCKEFSMTIPILPWEETCSTAGKHYLCYRVRCNLAKKCYVDELKNKVIVNNNTTKPKIQ